MAREKDIDKLHAIYKATLQLVLKQGFSGLRMGDVAKEAGIATGTVYIYFQDKNDLINQLYLWLKSRNVEAYMLGYDASKPFMNNFRQLWYQYAQVSLAAPQESAFLEQYYRSPFLSEEVRNTAENMLKPIYELLAKGKAEHLVKDFPTELLIAQLMGPIHELVKFHAEGKFSVDEIVLEQAFRLAWDSIKS
ncbi:MAG: TetR/AcrR family transcriptional regulator [Thermoflexibacter sp.]|jgi:AcrR family transcriptional regulator|nr:TetR/AcrR family transcriptional regulator [Thermoflexibacter sp.]